MVYMALVDDLAMYRRSVDWCRFHRWWSTVRRSWRRRARMLADNDLLPLPVASASSFALITANDDLFTVKVSWWRRPSVMAVVVPANNDFFSLKIIVYRTSFVALIPSDDYFS